MDLPAIIAKLTGVVILIWTARSIYRHFAQRKSSHETASEAKTAKSNSITEQLLNNLLLYLWFAFMVIFSTGMILNN